MKILLSGRRFIPPLVGGVDVYADRLGRALQRLGHEASIVALDSTAEGQDTAIRLVPDEHNGLPVWRLRFAFDGRPAQAFAEGYDPEMGTAVRRLLEAERPDLFVILNFYTLTLAAVEAAAGLGIPVFHIATDFVPVCRRSTLIRWNGQPCQVGEGVKSCAECFVAGRALGRVASLALNRLPEEWLLRWAEKGAAARPPHPFWLLKPYWRQINLMRRRLKRLDPLRRQIALVLAPTRYTAERFVANGFSARQVKVLPFGAEADHSLARVNHVPAAETRFLFIGRLEPYKGAHLLLEAFDRLEAPKGARLTVYGPADGQPAYARRLEALANGNERIRLGGQLPPDELAGAFALADYLVMPSIWPENSPLLLLDALQSRTPVIASRVGGMADLVQDGVNGMLFPMGDARALQGLLQQAIDRPALAQQLRSGGQLPGVDEYARSLVGYYQAQGV
ncbi:MAG: glycosyltransferase [Candidatus Promineifilaceae bacterium]